MVVLQHVHSLSLIDLNPKYPFDEEVYDDEEDLIIKQAFQYPCDRCDQEIAYLHRCEPSDSGTNITSRNYGDDRSILHLPLSEQTYNIIKDIILKGSKETSITHNSHEHPLILVDTVNKVKDICNVCVRPIVMDMPYYKCTFYDQGCNFLLHDWCTRLPAELEDHISHPYPQHTLILLPNEPDMGASLFECEVCFRVTNGFVYRCVECNYCIDVRCAFIAPEFKHGKHTLQKITHKSHPYHLLSIINARLEKNYCRMCLSGFTEENKASLSCESCNFHLHPECALLLPETIRHKYDKHPMTLCYSPIENHGGDYFCEVYEEELNPNACFYHCHECAQSIHSACAPLIPQAQSIPLYNLYVSSIFDSSKWVFDMNIKTGVIHKVSNHPHPLSLLEATESDGNCTKCNRRLNKNDLIFKCLQCKYTVHWLHHLELEL
ncbi:hypothetical protein L1987_14407 [Smallanthus sonchifolius]|uniref:Uncharacterized protein n=1 Tax=Smallanthus sonchifolius TaxID=185202 RepID=A0ACB9J2T7_9ASTR|nr:hypothetical protein L1987_14407 [Smallanthus sonchifolius]